jgi:hypothetical protein
MFDYVKCRDSRMVCSEGHDLQDCEFQTKSLDCTMDTYYISGNELSPGPGAPPFSKPYLGRLEMYAECRLCPAFVQAKTSNLISCPVDFEVEVIDNKVRAITRTSPSTKEWLEATPRETWMKGCQGPMTWDEAHKLHLDWHLNHGE